jgi:hypothetical protein
MYLKPLSTASVTTTAFVPSRSARRIEAATLAPEEIPAKMPSSRARRSVVSSASASGDSPGADHGVEYLELGPERAHELEAFLREACRDHDLEAVALHAADGRERRPGAAARVLDDGHAGLEQPVPLGPLDHREREPVLHRAGRIRVLQLDPDLAGLGRHHSAQADERRVPDRGENAFARPVHDRGLRGLSGKSTRAPDRRDAPRGGVLGRARI